MVHPDVIALNGLELSHCWKCDFDGDIESREGHLFTLWSIKVFTQRMGCIAKVSSYGLNLLWGNRNDHIYKQEFYWKFFLITLQLFCLNSAMKIFIICQPFSLNKTFNCNMSCLWALLYKQLFSLPQERCDGTISPNLNTQKKAQKGIDRTCDGIWMKRQFGQCFSFWYSIIFVLSNNWPFYVICGSESHRPTSARNGMSKECHYFAIRSIEPNLGKW